MTGELEGMPIVRFTGDDMTRMIIDCLTPIVGYNAAVNGIPIEVTYVGPDGIGGYRLSKDWGERHSHAVEVWSWIDTEDVEVP
jgi:hypothetical protein